MTSHPDSSNIEPIPNWGVSLVQQALQRTAGMSDHEGILLWKVNQARHILAAAEQYPSDRPTRLEPWQPSEVTESTYYDVIASLLISGSLDGFDERELCPDAIDQMHAILVDAREEARTMDAVSDQPRAR